jgi:hypothetical protein
MNHVLQAPVWADLKKKLKEHYVHLTEDDFAEMENHAEDWLNWLHRRAGGSALGIAHLVDEVISFPTARPLSRNSRSREALCA